jgi:2'-5' RNA ligase
MSPALISDIAARPHRGVVRNEHFDPETAPAEGVFRRLDSVFFALQPPPEIARCAHRVAKDLRDAHGLHCPLVRPQCLHVTLLGIGRYAELSPAMIAAFCAAATSVAMAPFRVALNRATSFAGDRERPLVLLGDGGVTGIEMLRRKLLLALRGAGFRSSKIRSFTPHMTLLYDRRDLGEHLVEEIGWTVRDFVLIHSLYGQSRHIPLARWPLRG